jgi:hypothetical protein
LNSLQLQSADKRPAMSHQVLAGIIDSASAESSAMPQCDARAELVNLTDQNLFALSCSEPLGREYSSPEQDSRPSEAVIEPNVWSRCNSN